MKLKKVTKRRFADGSFLAHALDLLGERWALLVVRELLFGPRRFSELAAGLPGVSAKTLTERLDGLTATGIVLRRKLPSPASVQVYELTPWGLESEAAILALGRWAARSPGYDPALPVSTAALMLSLRTMLDPERAAGLVMVVGFRIGEDSFVTLVSGGGIAIQRADPAGCDVTIEAPDAMAFAAALFGQDHTGLTLSGDAVLGARFLSLFPRPG